MRLVLPAFGLGTGLFNEYFYGMPAVSMSRIGPGFVPDYPILLLFDEFVVDAGTVDLLRDAKRRSWYGNMATLLQALNSSGRLVVTDFSELVNPFRQEIRDSVSHDLRDLKQWVPAFEESVARWRAFSQMGLRILSDRFSKGSQEESILRDVFEHGYYGHSVSIDHKFGDLLERLDSEISSEDQDYIRAVFADYLLYISNNLRIADATNAFIHDWQDIEPLYRKKFNLAIRSDEDLSLQNRARQLFAVLFPEFHLKNVATFVKVLDEARVESLRTLIRDASTGEGAFDEAFANATLREVLKTEQKVGLRRRVVGWATLPLGFIPWLGTPLQKMAEEVVSRPLDAGDCKDREWFYLVSEMSG